MLELESEQPAAEGGAEIIDHRHDQVDREDQGEQAVFQEETDGNLDLLAEPSDPDLDEDKTSWAFPSQRTQQFWKSPCSSPGLSPRYQRLGKPITGRHREDQDHRPDDMRRLNCAIWFSSLGEPPDSYLLPAAIFAKLIVFASTPDQGKNYILPKVIFHPFRNPSSLHLVPPACFRRGSTCKKSTLEYTTYE